MLTVVWAVPATCMVLQMYASAYINGADLPAPLAVVPAAAEWLVWIPLTPVVIWVAQRFPLLWPPGASALVVHVTGIIAASMLRGAVYAGATMLVGRVSTSVTYVQLWRRISIGWLPIAAVVWGAIAAAAAAIAYAKRAKENEAHGAALREQLARAELGALRARLHPHFLFNALHSVGALVRAGDNAGVVRVVAALSDLLRDVLSRDAPEMVRLRDELSVVRRYLDIEALRFADRLRIEWQVDPETTAAVVPSLVVQPLVENAMRHAIAASWSAGRVRISTRRIGRVLAIDVSDDGPGPAVDAGHRATGTGLADTRARLDRLYGADGTLTMERGELGGATASVRLPYRSTFATT